MTQAERKSRDLLARVIKQQIELKRKLSRLHSI